MPTVRRVSTLLRWVLYALHTICTVKMYIAKFSNFNCRIRSWSFILLKTMQFTLDCWKRVWLNHSSSNSHYHFPFEGKIYAPFETGFKSDGSVLAILKLKYCIRIKTERERVTMKMESFCLQSQNSFGAERLYWDRFKRSSQALIGYA